MSLPTSPRLVRQGEWSRACFGTLKPHPRLTISEWADLYRWIPQGTSPEWGPWQTSRIPYIREILNAVSDPAVEEVTWMAASQVAKTEFVLNVIGFFADQDPSPILLVWPTTETVEEFSKDRIVPMFRDSRRLSGLLEEEASSRKSSNTIKSKRFPGGYLAMVGANAPSGLASRPIRVVLRDETDRFPASAGVEGDPLKLSRQRASNFHNRKIVNTSTPTIHGQSNIERLYQESDQRRYWVPCPHCGHMQVLRWEQVKLKDSAGEWDAAGAHYECESCRGRIEDRHKSEMLAGGEWRAEAPFKGHAGFQLSALYSPWVKFSTLAEEFIKTRKDRDRHGLKEFVNLRLGEAWVEGNDVVEGGSLLLRARPYGAKLPEEILLLTASVDTQDDRLEMEVVGWGPGKESWGIEHRVLMGSPAYQQVWQSLDHAHARTYETEDGRKLAISCMTVDSGGHYTQEVYAYCAPKERRRIYAIKGASEPGKPTVSKPSRNNRLKAALFHLGVDSCKDTLFANLQLPDPGPGYCHFAGPDQGYTEEYFKGLLSEKRVTKIRGGKQSSQWEKLSSHIRNEPLDCRVYAMAALEILNPNFEALQRNKEAAGRPAPKQQRTGRSLSNLFNFDME